MEENVVVSEHRQKSSEELLKDSMDANDVKAVPSGIQSNRSERAKAREEQVVINTGGQKEAAHELNRQRSFSQTYDGVFQNLTAKPEIMILPTDERTENNDPPPAYVDERRTSQQVRYMTIDDQNLADSVDEVVLDEYEVGTVLTYILFVCLVVLFPGWGILLAFSLANSHASHYGAFGGLGLFIAFRSISLEEDLQKAMRPSLQGWAPLISLFVGVLGYLLFIFSLTAYQKVRRVAGSMINLPGTQAPGEITIITT